MIFETVFFSIFGAMVTYFVWRYLRHGSLIAAFLEGEIERELAEIRLSKRRASSETLKVYAMRSPDGERFIGFSIVSNMEKVSGLFSLALF